MTLSDMPFELSSRPFSHFLQSPAAPCSGLVRTGDRRRVLHQSRLAELMLVNRLRARIRHDLTEDTLARAAEVIGVTARQWFGDAGRSAVFPEPGA